MTRVRTRRARAAKLEQERSLRREALLVLLARVDRGVLTRPEAARLRSLVDVELAETDAARRAAGGQQAAARRAQQRIEAAELAIRELEAERDDFAERLHVAARLAGSLADDVHGDAWHRVEAVRAVCAGQMSAQQALDGTSGVRAA